MPEEIDGQPAVEPTPDSPEVTEAQPKLELPDDPATELERVKAEYAEMVKQSQATKAEKDALEKRLRDNQEYISRTRNAEKARPEVERPAKTFDQYLDEVSKKFEDDPKEGLKTVIRDIAHDRDLERVEYEKRIAQAEDRAFRKALSVNPESNKVLEEVRRFDEENEDLQGIPFERKIEFIGLKKAAVAARTGEVRKRVDAEADLAGGVGGGVRRGGERIPSWVNDPDVVKEARGAFGSKQELMDWSDPDKAKAMYERERAKRG
jgi:regulator of replication initiation timing